MTYLLDTNICVRLLNGDEVLKEKVRAVGVASLAITNAFWLNCTSERSIHAASKRI